MVFKWSETTSISIFTRIQGWTRDSPCYDSLALMNLNITSLLYIRRLEVIIQLNACRITRVATGQSSLTDYLSFVG